MSKPSLISTTRAAIRDSPREIYNWWLILCTCVWSFSGVAKGFDEGNIASLVVMKSWKKAFHVNHQSDAQFAGTKGKTFIADNRT